MKSETMSGTIFDDLVVLDHSESSWPNREDVPEIKLAPHVSDNPFEFWVYLLDYNWIPDMNQGHLVFPFFVKKS